MKVFVIFDCHPYQGDGAYIYGVFSTHELAMVAIHKLRKICVSQGITGFGYKIEEIELNKFNPFDYELP